MKDSVAKTVPLGDVVDVIGGGTPSKRNPAFYGGEIPWATVRDMNVEHLQETEHSITPAGLKGSSSKIIPAGEIVIATRVGLGKVCILGQDTAINQDLRGLVPKSDVEIDRRFLFHWYKSIADKVIEAGTGATVQGVKLPFVKSLPFPTLTLEEQQRIVAVLDEAFEGLDRARAHAEANLQNARELFENYREEYLDPTSRDDWWSVQLDQLIDIKHGFAFKSAFFEGEGQYAVLTPGNYYETGGFKDRAEKQRYYSGEFPSEFIVKKGDLLVAMTEQAPGLLGSCMIVPEDDRFLHNQRLGLITPKNDVSWSAEYFAQAFNLKAFRKGLSDTCSGATVRHTSPKRILAESVPYCEDVAQLDLAAAHLSEREEDCRLMEKSYRAKVKDLDGLRQSFLKKAFAGELT